MEKRSTISRTRGILRRLFGPIIRPIVREFSFVSGNYLILIISWVLMDIAMEMPVPYYQQYVYELGGKTFTMALGIIGAANFFAMAIVAIPGGYLADKYGRRWLISTMTFGMAFSYLFFAFAPTWHFILIGTIIHSLCLIYQPALFAMVQDSVPPQRRGVGSSLIQMIHGTFNTPGPVIGGALVLAFGVVLGMRYVYLIVLALFVTAAVARLRLKETIMIAQPIRFRYFISSYPQAVRESLGVWKVVPRSVFWLFLVQMMTMFTNALVNVKNAIYAQQVLNIPQDQWFLTYVPMLVTMVVASYPIGKLVDRAGPKLPLTVGPIVLASSLLLFVNGDIVMIMISMALQGLVHLFVMSSAMALTASLVEPQNRGKVRGGVNFVGYMLTGGGMLLGSYLYDLVPQWPFYLAMALAIPMLFIITLKVQQPKETDKTY